MAIEQSQRTRRFHGVKDIASPGIAPALSVPFGLVEDAFDRLTRRVQGMSEEAFHYTGPAGNVNSTAMLLRHLTVIDLEYLHQIMGKPVPAELASKYGPHEDEKGQIPQVQGMTGAQLLEEYRTVMAMAREYMGSLTDEDATRVVTIPWWPEPATVRYVLWHMAGHSSNHQGHIMRLKAAFKQG